MGVGVGVQALVQRLDRKALFGFSTSQIIREGDVRVPSGPQLGHKMSGSLHTLPVSSSLATPDLADPIGFLEHRVPGGMFCVSALLSCPSY